MAQKFLIPVMSCLLRFLKLYGCILAYENALASSSAAAVQQAAKRDNLGRRRERLKQTWCFSELQATNLANAEGSLEAMILKQAGWCDCEPDTVSPKPGNTGELTLHGRP